MATSYQLKCKELDLLREIGTVRKFTDEKISDALDRIAINDARIQSCLEFSRGFKAV